MTTILQGSDQILSIPGHADQVKLSFVIFDIWVLWRSGLSVRVPGCQELQLMAYPSLAQDPLQACFAITQLARRIFLYYYIHTISKLYFMHNKLFNATYNTDTQT